MARMALEKGPAMGRPGPAQTQATGRRAGGGPSGGCGGNQGSSQCCAMGPRSNWMQGVVPARWLRTSFVAPQRQRTHGREHEVTLVKQPLLPRCSWSHPLPQLAGHSGNSQALGAKQVQETTC